jgi:hypothetical protein
MEALEDRCLLSLWAGATLQPASTAQPGVGNQLFAALSASGSQINGTTAGTIPIPVTWILPMFQFQGALSTIIPQLDGTGAATQATGSSGSLTVFNLQADGNHVTQLAGSTLLPDGVPLDFAAALKVVLPPGGTHLVLDPVQFNALGAGMDLSRVDILIKPSGNSSSLINRQWSLPDVNNLQSLIAQSLASLDYEVADLRLEATELYFMGFNLYTSASITFGVYADLRPGSPLANLLGEGMQGLESLRLTQEAWLDRFSQPEGATAALPVPATIGPSRSPRRPPPSFNSSSPQHANGKVSVDPTISWVLSISKSRAPALGYDGPNQPAGGTISFPASSGGGAAPAPTSPEEHTFLPPKRRNIEDPYADESSTLPSVEVDSDESNADVVSAAFTAEQSTRPLLPSAHQVAEGDEWLTQFIASAAGFPARDRFDSLLLDFGGETADFSVVHESVYICVVRNPICKNSGAIPVNKESTHAPCNDKDARKFVAHYIWIGLACVASRPLRRARIRARPRQYNLRQPRRKSMPVGRYS